MRNKHHKANNQLSLALEHICRPTDLPQPNGILDRTVLTNVINFPSRSPSAPSFRERVIQDLIRNHVTVE